MSGRFDLVPIEELPVPDLVDVINQAFGRQETVDWYRWKHQEGPWGPSLGIAAVDRDGPIGLRLLLPWRFRLGEETILGHRATEAATIPRAQGQGVFTALNTWMMEQVATELIFSTPNEKSRGGYLKLGWEVIARVPHRWEVAGRARRTVGAPNRSSTPLATDWTREALEWRTDPRCRNRYLEASASDDGSSVYYRLVPGRWPRTVAPLGVLGSRTGIAEAWQRMIREARARLVLRPVSQPAPERAFAIGRKHGESLLIGWVPPGGRLEGPRRQWLEEAPWTAADLEGVI